MRGRYCYCYYYYYYYSYSYSYYYYYYYYDYGVLLSLLEKKYYSVNGPSCDGRLLGCCQDARSS